MQLLYVYIGGYEDTNQDGDFAEFVNSPFKVFKDEELNFSNQFEFKFQDNELTIKLIEEYVPFFFSKKKLKSVTAIIGKNGSGKSTILELLKKSKADNITNIPHKMIYIFGDVNAEMGVDQEFLIVQNEKLDVTYSFSRKKLITYSFFKIGDVRELDLVRLPHIVYYSPILNIEFSNVRALYEIESSHGITDISTSHLILKDAETSTNSDKKTKGAIETLIRHKVKDTERQFTFAKENQEISSRLDLTIPRFIEFVVDTNDEIELTSVNASFIQTRIDKFNLASKELAKWGKERFILKAFRAAYFNFIRYAAFMTSITLSEKTFERFDAFLFSNFEKHSIQELLNKSLDFKFENDDSLLYEHFNTIWQARIKFLQELLALDEYDFKPYSDNPNCILDVKNVVHNKVVEAYFSSFQITGFLLTNWKMERVANGSLSSGEQMRFSLFSRFYDAYKKFAELSPSPKNVLLLLDEAETSYHPEWQRTFFNDFKAFLETVFLEIDSIQIILSTHSPFISSDLPWFSIIRLEKATDAGLTKVDYKKQNTTFAANIHDLFADSFYMDKGFVGAFAVEKIKNLFERIKQPTLDEIPGLEREIKLIGEPFIQMSLLEALKENTSNE